MDFAVITMNSIKSDFDVVWPLYVDAMTIPAFDAKEFDRIKQDAINSLRAQASQPDYAISKLAKQTAFRGKNYAKSPEGTEPTVSSLTVEETKAHYTSVFTKSRMLIVVVGEIEKSELENKIKAMLSKVPAGGPFQLKKEMYSPSQNSFVSEKKELATNYIQAVSSAPLPGTADYNAFTLAMRILSDRHFLEIRTKNGLSYAPFSYFDGGLSPTSNIGLSTTEPNKYIGMVNNMITKTKKEGVTDEEVKNMKSRYITTFYYRLETNSAQAGSLATNEVLHNNWRRSLTLNEDLKKVSAADVNKAFSKYFSNLTWVYQGDPSKVDPALYKASNDKIKLPASKVIKPKADKKM